mmetsp:Transcript_102178/g.288640  ORF Transcript_102178/g.288640 Transcript_102178/m.288640 type:complete len:297 (+) Transcript_102178:1391-2281(+)
MDLHLAVGDHEKRGPHLALRNDLGAFLVLLQNERPDELIRLLLRKVPEDMDLLRENYLPSVVDRLLGTPNRREPQLLERFREAVLCQDAHARAGGPRRDVAHVDLALVSVSFGSLLYVGSILVPLAALEARRLVFAQPRNLPIDHHGEAETRLDVLVGLVLLHHHVLHDDVLLCGRELRHDWRLPKTLQNEVPLEYCCEVLAQHLLQVSDADYQQLAPSTCQNGASVRLVVEQGALSKTFASPKLCLLLAANQLAIWIHAAAGDLLERTLLHEVHGGSYLALREDPRSGLDDLNEE